MNRWARVIGRIGLAGVLLAACTPEMTVEELSVPPPQDPDFSGLQGQELQDECLVGFWVMRRGDLDIFVATLVPVPNLTVPSGSLHLTMSSTNEYAYYSEDLAIRVTLGTEDNYIQGNGSFRTEGVYATDIGALTLTDSGSRKEVMEWIAVKGSASIQAPGAGPEFSLIPGGPVSYECYAEELVIDFPGPTGSPIPMIFKRVTN